MHLGPAFAARPERGRGDRADLPRCAGGVHWRRDGYAHGRLPGNSGSTAVRENPNDKRRRCTGRTRNSADTKGLRLPSALRTKRKWTPRAARPIVTLVKLHPPDGGSRAGTLGPHSFSPPLPSTPAPPPTRILPPSPPWPRPGGQIPADRDGRLQRASNLTLRSAFKVITLRLNLG